MLTDYRDFLVGCSAYLSETLRQHWFDCDKSWGSDPVLLYKPPLFGSFLLLKSPIRRFFPSASLFLLYYLFIFQKYLFLFGKCVCPEQSLNWKPGFNFSSVGSLRKRRLSKIISWLMKVDICGAGWETEGTFSCGFIWVFISSVSLLHFVLVQGWLDGRVQLRKRGFFHKICAMEN